MSEKDVDMNDSDMELDERSNEGLTSDDDDIDNILQEEDGDEPNGDDSNTDDDDDNEENDSDNESFDENFDMYANDNDHLNESMEDDRRKSNRSSKSISDSDFVDSSDLPKDSSKDFSVEIAADLSHKYPAVNKFFSAQLFEYLCTLRPEDEVKAVFRDWTVLVHNRPGALSVSILDLLYISSKGKKCRTRLEVAICLNFTSARAITNELLFIAAKENRERLLISQMLIGREDACSNIYYDDNDQIKIDFNDNISLKDIYFSFGNTVILDWGKIVDWPGFHTSTQIFPLGFKCIRQEHDIILDRVVDCLCEIDVFDPKKESYRSSLVGEMKEDNRVTVSEDPVKEDRVASLPSPSSDTKAETKAETKVETEAGTGTGTGTELASSESKRPLFRVTVMWDLSDTKQTVRSYEGFTPQEVWQAVMVECVGMRRSDTPLDLSKLFTMGALVQPSNSNPVEMIDDDERFLRSQLRDLRLKYLKTIRAKQKDKESPPMHPRIPIENLNNLMDEYISRFFEGMNGILECKDYNLIDTRVKDSNYAKFTKVNYIKYIAAVQTKYKHLERIHRKNLTLKIIGEREIREKEKRDDLEARKKAKLETKESRLQRQALYSQKKTKLKETERYIRMLKEGFAKEIKKRRDEARTRVEALVDLELPNRATVNASIIPMIIKNDEYIKKANSMKNLTSRPPIPIPSEDIVIFDNDGFGKVLELWGLLTSYVSILDMTEIPSIRKIETALQVCDPYLSHVRNLLRNSNSVANYYENKSKNVMSSRDAESLLTQLGIALTKNLLSDYYKIIGFDPNDPLFCGTKFEVNEISWKEISRSVLIWYALKLLGMADIDIIAHIKGKGHTTTPDSMDKKTLKLARRRMIYSFNERKTGGQKPFDNFTSGLIVRVNKPCPVYNPGYSWKELISLLTSVDSSAGWLVYKIIESASEAVVSSKSGSNQYTQRISDLLKMAISPPHFNMHDAKLSKYIAFYALRKFGGNSNPQAIELLPRNVEGCLTAFDMWAEQSKGFSSTAKPGILPDHFGEEREGWGMDRLRIYLSTIDPVKYPVIKTLNDDFNPSNDINDKEKSVTGELEEDAEEIIDKEDAKQKGDLNSPEAMELENKNSLSPDTQSSQYEADLDVVLNLTVAMQRCYLTLRDIISHEKAIDFLHPVDPVAHPLYYDYIRQPLCLDDIRHCLLTDGYSNSIYKFYKDVSLVFENAQVYNSELTIIAQAAQKLMIIFDRLFLEMVLCFDAPLSFHSYCHSCRSPVNELDPYLVCERCEAFFHLTCTQQRSIPKSDWLCPHCISQRGVESIHPLKGFKFQHPKTQKPSEVLSIEQHKRAIRYLILSAGKKEYMTGDELRKAAYQPKFRPMEKLDSDVQNSPSCPTLPGVPMLPQGYFYDDYDKVCGLALGYKGYSKPQCVFYPSDLYSQETFRRRIDDFHYEELIRGLAAIEYGENESEWGYREWTSTLNAIAQRILNTNKIDLLKVEEITDTNNNNNNGATGNTYSNSNSLDKLSYETLLEPSRLLSNKSLQSEALISSDKVKLDKSLETKKLKEDNEKNDFEEDLEDEADENINEHDDGFNLEDEIDVNNNISSSTTDPEFQNPDKIFEKRSYSRSKGREDALFSVELSRIITSEVDLTDDEDEDEKRDRGVAPDAPSALMHCVLRVCTPKPPESIVESNLWQESFNSKMEKLQKEVDSGEESLCDFCGLSEKTLASCFVCIESQTEWDVRENLESIKYNQVKLLPHDDEDSQIEENECKDLSASVVLKRGSKVAHACCAEVVATSRMGTTDKIEKQRKRAFDKNARLEHMKALEILNYLSRGRNLPIGMDKLGNTYWVFLGSKAVYVRSPSPSVLNGLSEGRYRIASGIKMSFGSALNATNCLDMLTAKCISSRSCDIFIGYADGGHLSDCLWSVYESPNDISNLLDWLDATEYCERILSIVLKRLFPEALSCLPKSRNSSSFNTHPEDKAMIEKILGYHKNSFVPSWKADIPLSDVVSGEKRLWSELVNIDVDDPINIEDSLLKSNPSSKKIKQRNEGQFENEFLSEGAAVLIVSSDYKGTIVDTKHDDEQRIFYKVRLDNWGEDYDSWYNEYDLLLYKEDNRPSLGKDDDDFSDLDESYSEFEEIPYLKTLTGAIYHLYEPDRNRGRIPPPKIPNCRTALEILKLSMLVVEAALPIGALDTDSDDRWGGEDFSLIWRDSVLAAGDATSLMACQIILEYGIKTAWLKPGGIKLLSLMPSRFYSMKFASTGLISLRLSALDQAIRYNKVTDPSKTISIPASTYNKKKKK